MTIEKLQEILSNGNIGDIIKGLQVTSFPKLPKWSDLEKQYDPSKHSIWDTAKYPVKKNDDGLDDFKRTALALQELAVNRVAQAMFATPVQRSYNYDATNEKAAKAVALLEEIYRTRNHIDSENISRGELLNASCQIATVWRVKQEPTRVNEETSQFKLTHTTYSEKDGFKLYPITDPYGDLICLSIGYTDEDNKEHMYVYVKGGEGKAVTHHYFKEADWVEVPEENKELGIFPVVYANYAKPVWGGDTGTQLVEQLEEMESYQGLYIKRNALPTFTLDYGDLPPKTVKSKETEKSSDSKRIIKVGKGGNMKDVTWEGAAEAVTARYGRLRNSFFEQIQVPDTSFSTMIQSNTSAENKELVFADAKSKAKALGGVWEKLFYDEMEIVKRFAAVMFSSYSKEFEMLSCRTIIQPYSIKTKKETAEYVSTAGDAMSLNTKVKVLGEVDDVQAEVDMINEDNAAASNQGVLKI